MNGGGLRLKAQFAGDPRSVRSARALLRETLRDWDLDALTEVAELLVSELATNAVLHAGSDFVVEAGFHGGVLRVGVADVSASGPRRRDAPVTAGTGRGLALVAVLATAWGTDPATPPWAKTVWFELALS